MTTLLSKRQWYAVQVRSNQEVQVAEFLKNRLVEHFLPTYSEASKRQDRKVILSKPLFKGYLFAHVDYRKAERVEVLKAPGTVKIVTFSDSPVPVPDEVIESIQILVGAKDGATTVKPHPLVQAGRKVKVVEGAFRGAVGRLHETEDRHPKLVVEIEFLGRAVSVPIAMEQVQPHFSD